MNYKWTTNLHDKYPLIQVMKPEGYIPPSLHTLRNHKLTVFHLGDEYLCTNKILLPPGDNRESLEAAANEEDEINDDLNKHKAQKSHQRPPKAPYPNLNKYMYNVLLAWEFGETIYEPLSVLEADAPVTLATYDGWKMHKNFPQSAQHNLSSLAPPKGEMKRFLSWTRLFKSPTSSTLCFGEATLGKLNQVKLFCSLSSSILWDPTLAKSSQEIKLCITKHIPLCDSSVDTGNPFSVPSSSFETNRVSNSHSSLVTTPSSRMIFGQPKIKVTKVHITMARMGSISMGELV